MKIYSYDCPEFDKSYGRLVCGSIKLPLAIVILSIPISATGAKTNNYAKYMLD